MKKIVLSILLILSMLLTFAACDMSGANAGEKEKKDDPEKNADYLVSSLNEGTNFEEIQGNMQPVDINEVLAELKETAFEANLSGTVDGESGNIYVSMKDMVVYTSISQASEAYVFIEDDLTMVSVSGMNGEYYANVDTSVKDFVDAWNALEGEEGTTAPEEDVATSSDMLGVIEDLLDAVMSAELPEATEEDIKYEDGKYYLDSDYIKSVLDKCVDVVFDELDAEMFGWTESDLLDSKAMVKGYLEYIDVEIYYYIECEEITGVGMAITLDEEFAVEKVGYSEVAVSYEICVDKLALDVRIANEDDVLADIDASIKFKTDKDDKIKSLKVDVKAEVKSTSYEYDEETYEYVEVDNMATFDIEFDANFEDMSDGKGEFLTCEIVYSEGESSVNISVKADSSNKGDKISCDLSIVATEDGETQESTLELDVNTKSAENMPEIPQAIIDEKNQAIEEYNSRFDWMY